MQVFPRPESFVVDEEIDPIPKVINTGNFFFFLTSTVVFYCTSFFLTSDFYSSLSRKIKKKCQWMGLTLDGRMPCLRGDRLVVFRGEVMS